MPTIQTIMEKMDSKIRAEIATGQSLSFMVGEPEAILITDAPPEDIPKRNYKKYKIVLFPDPDNPLDEIPRIGNLVQRNYVISIALFRKARKRRKWLIFTDSNNTSDGTGLYDFANFIMDILRNNTLDGTVIVKSGQQFSTPNIEETDDPLLSRIDFNYMTETLDTVDTDGVP